MQIYLFMQGIQSNEDNWTLQAQIWLVTVLLNSGFFCHLNSNNNALIYGPLLLNNVDHN